MNSGLIYKNAHVRVVSHTGSGLKNHAVFHIEEECCVTSPRASGREAWEANIRGVHITKASIRSCLAAC